MEDPLDEAMEVPSCQEEVAPPYEKAALPVSNDQASTSVEDETVTEVVDDVVPPSSQEEDELPPASIEVEDNVPPSNSDPSPPIEDEVATTRDEVDIPNLEMDLRAEEESVGSANRPATSGQSISLVGFWSSW